MGWCAEFGVQICDGCGELMVAARDRCRCDACGTDCTGKFSGCPEVWARGPKAVEFGSDAGLRIARRSISGASRVDHPDEDLLDGAAVDGDPSNGAGVQKQLDGIVTLVAGQQAAVSRMEHDQTVLVEQQEAISKLARDQALLLDAVRGAERGSVSGAARQDFLLSRIEQVANHLGQSLGEASATVATLRNETERVTAIGELAHASLEVARQIERTTARLDRRLHELAQLLSDLGDRIDRVMGPDGAPPAKGSAEPSRRSDTA